MDNSYYLDLHRRSAALLAAVKGLLGERDVRQVQSLLDAGEYGLVVEQLAAGLHEAGIVPAPSVRKSVLDLAATMGLQDDEYVRALRDTPAEAHPLRA